MTKICMVSCYMGELPSYTQLFLSSCKLNSSVDFLFFGSHVRTGQVADNIRLVNLSFDSLREMLERKLGFTVALGSAEKLCEFKPTYGHIFEEYLSGYDFWGVSDIDLILGNVRTFFTEDLLRETDVFSTVGHKWLSGAFTVYRNTPELTRLYSAAPTYKQTFQDPAYRFFDEAGCRWQGVEHEISHLVENGMTVAMWDVAMELRRKNLLRVHTPAILCEYPPFSPFTLRWTRGHLFDVSTGEQFLGYHMVHSKRFLVFQIPDWTTLPDSFWITMNGISVNEPSSP